MHNVKRLITQFIPENYKLSLVLSRTDRKLKGTVVIKGELTLGSTAIGLHHKDLEIESVLIDGKQAFYSAGENDELIINQENLAPGVHIVVIAYSGKITDSLHGLYPCYYDNNGEKKELLVTQFESHSAREVFPCIDEPEAKATFDLTLTTETGVTTLSNQPIKTTSIENEQMVTTFETTPKMSTYLLAWVVGDLHKKSSKTKSGVEVSVWATPAQPSSSLDFALDVAVRSIEFYEEYFKTEYPLPKSDHVALPDFSNGAMENWGLVTYRETALLAEPGTTSIGSKQLIATIITHELAHQWFGNLVTMKWWNDLWLNESFATMMEYVCTDSLFPEWNIWLNFSTNETISALRRDCIDGVQPVQVEISHPDEIETIFDHAIVYAKGGRLLRMLQHYVGPQDFRAGLKNYFDEHAYSNTVGNDLWTAIAKSSDKDIVSLMNTWIAQPGYPVIHVTKNEDNLKISQEQFFVGPHSESSKSWIIPLGSSSKDVPELLSEKEILVPLSSTESVHFNVDDSAHFITHYDETSFSALLSEVRAGKLSITERLQLLHESTLLARGGIISTASLINILDSYNNETNEQVWTIIFVTLKELRKFVENDEASEKKLRKLSAAIAKNQYERLGWTVVDNEPEQDTKLRSTIISLTLYGEGREAIDTAKNIYNSTDIEKIDAELRPLILSSVVRYGDEKIVDELVKIYKTTSSAELKEDIAIGITSTKIQNKIDDLLELIKDQRIIRSQDTLHWYLYLLGGKESREKTWRWIRANWDWVNDKFGDDKSYNYFTRFTASNLSSRKHLDEYCDFFLPLKNDPSLTRVIEMGISEIEGRVALIEKDGPSVREKLNDL
jgi:aminopeptidase N